MLKFLLLTLAAMLSPVATLAATRLPTAVDPVFTGGSFASAIVTTPDAKQVLYEYRADEPHVVASLTKLASANTFLTFKIPMSRTVAMESRDEVGGGRLRVGAGAKMTVKDLFYSSITASANNTATALSRLTKLTPEQYIARMNLDVAKLGATSTVFFDASGMDERNMTTARDMSKIASKAFLTPDIQRPAQTMTYKFYVTEGKTRYLKTINNTNHLLTAKQHDDLWVMAGKTGYLEESMYNLAVRLRPVDERGKSIPRQEVLVIVLGSATKEGSFDAAKQLAQWAWNSHAF